MNITKIKKNLAIILLLITDLISLILIFELAKAIRLYILPDIISLPPFTHTTISYIWIFPIYIIIFFYEKLYFKTFSLWDEIKIIIKSVIISFIVILSILFFGKLSQAYSRTLIITYNVFLILLFPITRTFVRKLLYRSDLLVKKALIIGSNGLAEDIYSSFKKEPNLCYKVAGFIDDRKDDKRIEYYKVHRGIKKIYSYIKLAHITDVIIAKENIGTEELSKLINHIQHRVENVIYVPEISGIAAYGTDIKYFFNQQMIAFEIKNNLSNPITYISKRIIDYILSVIIFAVIIIPMIAVMILIKLTSPGAVIYSQERIGKNGKPFRCYKFRTMFNDADERLKEILSKDPDKKKEWETYWKLKDDPRITPIGKFIRKTSIDELPQIFNVLKGEMSLVGPRPYLPREWNFIKEESYIIHALPPGITGLWQVSGRSNTSYEQRVSIDSWYVKNWNLWLDIVILLKTVRAVIRHDGAC
jgi:Undecaprenyl-phosphate galactose phosphotransferase WbaP